MGMVVGTEVVLDLHEVCAAGLSEKPVRQGTPAMNLRHLVPIRLATWVVHSSDGWLGRVQAWDEDVTVRFSADDNAPRCRLRAANQRQGVTIVEGFYRDFF